MLPLTPQQAKPRKRCSALDVANDNSVRKNIQMHYGKILA